MDTTKFPKMTRRLLTFVLGVGLSALSLRISGLLFGTTINVGEVVITKHDVPDGEADTLGNPGTTTYCISETMDQIIGTTFDFYAVFMALVGIALVFHTQSP